MPCQAWPTWLQHSGTKDMEGGRAAGCSSHGHKKEGTWGRTTRCPVKHGQLGFNIQEPRTMEGGRAVGGSSHGHKKEGTWGRTSRHPDKHGQLGFNIQEPRTMEGGRAAGGSSCRHKKEAIWDRAPFHLYLICMINLGLNVQSLKKPSIIVFNTIA